MSEKTGEWADAHGFTVDAYHDVEATEYATLTAVWAIYIEQRRAQP